MYDTFLPTKNQSKSTIHVGNIYHTSPMDPSWEYIAKGDQLGKASSVPPGFISAP